MMDSVAGALDAFLAYAEPHDGLSDNPFRLACSFNEPASATEIASAWPAGMVPGELAQLWSTSRQSKLFVDVDYGQWGLALLSPANAAKLTAYQRAQRPAAYRSDDIVIGSFLGDLDLVVLAPSETGRRHVLIALPLEDRLDWYAAANTLAEFLNCYLNSFGDKYWVQATH
jgi:hypothetical protein